MPKHWIFVTSPQNYRVCVKYGAYGVDERYRVTAQEHLELGDLVFFYVTDEKVFKGPWRIKDKGKYQPDHPAVKEWKPPGKQSNIKYVYIIPIEPLDQIKECPLEKVFDKLLFITNKRRGKRGGYSDHFQFSIISIREEDYNTILANTSSKPLSLDHFST